MKTQINNLVELAGYYAKAYSKDEYIGKFTYIKYLNPSISVFYNKTFDNWYVEFNYIKIWGKANTIEMPVDSDEEYLAELYNTVLSFYNTNIKTVKL